MLMPEVLGLVIVGGAQGVIVPLMVVLPMMALPMMALVIGDGDF
jgi:hypothetical protein